MKLILVLTIIFLSLCTTLQAQVENDTISLVDLNLNGQISSVNVTHFIRPNHRIKNSKRKGIKSKSSFKTATFNFTPKGEMSTLKDSTFWMIENFNTQYLNPTEYRIRFDSILDFEISEKIMEDSNAYEIHYRKFDTNGMLIYDSIRNKEFIEFDYISGPTVYNYIYDEHFNLVYYHFRTSFVIALFGSSFYEYKFDTKGNWIERRQYWHPASYKPTGSVEFKKKSQLEALTYREIIYTE